jgi:hypothetical protein
MNIFKFLSIDVKKESSNPIFPGQTWKVPHVGYVFVQRALSDTIEYRIHGSYFFNDLYECKREDFEKNCILIVDQEELDMISREYETLDEEESYEGSVIVFRPKEKDLQDEE